MNFVKISPKILEPRLPELGQIKIGGKGEKRGNFRIPVKFDHFVVTTRARDKQTENLIRDEAIHKKIGAAPVELDVRMLYDRPEDNFQFFLGAWDGRRARCRGNGERAIDAERGEVPCPCPWLKGFDGEYKGPTRPLAIEGKRAPSCKPHGRLSVILEAAQSFGGFYVFRTTSWETIRGIAAQLDLYLAQFGFLAGLPLRLVMYPTTDSYEEGGVHKTSNSYKVALVLRGSFDTARQLAAAAYERRQQLALPSPQSAEAHRRYLLEADVRDAKHISEEFHPEASVPPEWIEVEVVNDQEEDPAAAEEARRLEELVRQTLELCDWEQSQINKFVARNADLTKAIAYLEEKAPRQLARAREMMAKAPAAEGEGAAEVTSEAEPDPAVAETPASEAGEGDLFG